jgi:hypothetical protein
MKSVAEQLAAQRLFAEGLSDREIARRTGISRTTIQHWRSDGFPHAQRRGGHRATRFWRPARPESYCYLLGIYLGDGYVGHVDRSPVLEISLDPRYPGIVAECLSAIWTVFQVRGRVSTRRTGIGRSIRIAAGSGALPLAFPQHGPGKKHERPISLVTWQQDLVDLLPRPFLRGLIHSDGSRVINRFSVQLRGGPCEYAYPRYFFTNLSGDIRDLFCASCDRLGIRWTQSSPKNISVADRAGVALLDTFVGPKH